ncbi:MAG: TetR/AcrR family transcriptional regulator [Candidatus Heimdallarchaeum aukensis]|uniref:TetR/AcrR family transcriptional regulator n=1 Tax=Candidatus Heimdallarchaeum aukensis TaxID=2876573 RepID=A0A9Y1BL35_9ARCH|nr:MAG: TetR/AcrR family transcriptional regulator [Candidatus Heimdallarchaeum aukensis]
MRENKKEEHKWLKKEERKERILRTAIELFSKKGVAYTTMKDIAEEEGVSEALVYKYFRNKTEIFETIIKRGIELSNKMWKQFGEKIDELSENPYETLYRVSLEFWNFALKFRKILLILYKEFHNPELRPIFEELAQSTIALEKLTEFFRKCQEKGKIRKDVRAKTLAFLFISSSRPALGATGYLEEGFKIESNEIEENIKEILTILFEGIRK